MARQSVPLAPTRLDHIRIAAGLGEIKDSGGQSRVLDADGKTLAYLKKKGLAVRVAHVKRAPKKLGSFKPEKNGIWTNVAAADNEAARAVLEYVAAQARPKPKETP